MCQFVFTFCESARPAVFQVLYVLKFDVSRRYTLVGLLNCSENQLRTICWSARLRNPTSFDSKPGEKRSSTVWKRVMPPPNLLSDTRCASPVSDVRVGSYARLSSGRLYWCTLLRCVAAIDAADPCTDVPAAYAVNS